MVSCFCIYLELVGKCSPAATCPYPPAHCLRGFPDYLSKVFLLLEDSGTLDVVTYERGVEDVTLSCGTGSAASAIAGRLLGVVGDEVRVVNPGGVNDVSLTWIETDVVQPRLEGGALMIAEVRLLPEAFDAGCWRPALPKKYA